MFQKTPGRYLLFLQDNGFQVLTVYVVPGSAYKRVLTHNDLQMWDPTLTYQCFYGRTHV